MLSGHTIETDEIMAQVAAPDIKPPPNRNRGAFMMIATPLSVHLDNRNGRDAIGCAILTAGSVNDTLTGGIREHVWRTVVSFKF
jgi:hypothetical protein